MPAKRKSTKSSRKSKSKKPAFIEMQGMGRMVRMNHPQLGMGYMSQDGGSFWSDAGNWFKNAATTVYNNVAKPVWNAVAPGVIRTVGNAIQNKISGSGMHGGAMQMSVY